MTVTVQNMVVNIGKLIKTQKALFFSFDGMISISISPELTEFIIEVLNRFLLSIDHLQLCFQYLTTHKMVDIYQKSIDNNNQILLKLVSEGSFTESMKRSVRKLTGDLSCSFINQVCLKDLAESDITGNIIQPLLDFFRLKGVSDLSSISIFSAEYYEIPEIAVTEGFYLNCRNTVVPRNLSELNYDEKDMVDLSRIGIEDVLTRLSATSEDSLFVF
jgi:hypothetical protein